MKHFRYMTHAAFVAMLNADATTRPLPEPEKWPGKVYRGPVGEGPRRWPIRTSQQTRR